MEDADLDELLAFRERCRIGEDDWFLLPRQQGSLLIEGVFPPN